MKEISRLADTNPEIHRYDDIIGLPHPVSKSHPRMSLRDRAAQFSPFAALTGYEDIVRETARLTEERMELNEDSQRILDEKLRIIQEQIEACPEITITFFKPDERKSGGAYVKETGAIKRLDGYRRVIVLADGRKIPMDDVVDLEGKIL